MKVALVSLHFAEYTSRLALALSARHEVLLILSERNARDELTPALRQQVHRLTQARYLRLRGWRDPRVLATSLVVNRIVRQYLPDVVHVQEVNPALTAATLLHLSGSFPLVLTVHDPVGHSGTPHTRSWQFRLLRKLRSNASRIVVHGPRMRADLLQLDPRLAGRVDVVPHGILGNDDSIADSGGSETNTFLFFGRIERYKGLDTLLDATELLRSRGKAVKVVIAGTGDDLDKHRHRIAAFDNVELIDRYVAASDVGALFRRCTAVVLPYTDATQSGVAAIAIAHARPVIATRVGDLPDMLLDGRAGLLVPPRDPRALAQAMETLAEDSSRCDLFAAESAHLARGRLSWSRIAEQYVDSCQRAIDARKAIVPPASTEGRASPSG